MIVGWLHDYRLSEHGGGAQQTNRIVVEAAPRWAQVLRYYPGDVGDADLYILNNVKRFSRRELDRIRSKSYIVYEHDHWDIQQKWQAAEIVPTIEGALGVIFLSPLHRETFTTLHQARCRQSVNIPSPIEVDKFWPGKGPERKHAVWLGAYAWHKGVRDACRWARRNGPLDFYGFGTEEQPWGPRVHDRGRLLYEEVPGVLRQYENFVFFPRWPEPFGRAVAEAVLSGCEVIGNDRVGALSWGWRGIDEWRENVGNSPARFWATIEEWTNG